MTRHLKGRNPTVDHVADHTGGYTQIARDGRLAETEALEAVGDVDPVHCDSRVICE